MYHFYNQKRPPSSEEIANTSPIARVFYYASMEVAEEDNLERLRTYGF